MSFLGTASVPDQGFLVRVNDTSGSITIAETFCWVFFQLAWRYSCRYSYAGDYVRASVTVTDSHKR